MISDDMSSVPPDRVPKKSTYVPILKTKKQVAEEAKQQILQERTGQQFGLLTRFTKLNIAVGKYFRFKQVTLIAGLSGHGKSALLNMLLADFNNKELNKNFEHDVVIIHNTFEMLPANEVLRTVSSKVGKSHLYLLSSEWQKSDDPNTKGSYNKLSEEDLRDVELALEDDIDSDYYYFEEPTDIKGVLANVLEGIRYYKEKHNTDKNPKVVVALDHTLLLEGEKNEKVLDIMTKLSKTVVALKKKGYMVILVGQLNNEIEKPERIRNSDLHFPMKSDIYAQAQVYNACDNVIIIHRPELLGIREYGQNKLITSLLVHLYIIKQRFGNMGSAWLKNELNRGQFPEITPKSNKKDL